MSWISYSVNQTVETDVEVEVQQSINVYDKDGGEIEIIDTDADEDSIDIYIDSNNVEGNYSEKVGNIYIKLPSSDEIALDKSLMQVVHDEDSNTFDIHCTIDFNTLPWLTQKIVAELWDKLHPPTLEGVIPNKTEEEKDSESKHPAHNIGTQIG